MDGIWHVRDYLVAYLMWNQKRETAYATTFAAKYLR
jgi:hypothetical protein